MPKHLSLLFTTDFYTIPLTSQEEVYSEFYKLVYPMVQFIVRDHGATEDIIQEAFFRAVQKAGQLQELDRLEGWLKALTRNLSLNYLRKLKRNRGELEQEAVFSGSELSCAAAETVLEEQVESKIMEEAIIHYIDQLRPDYRQIIEMRWVQGMTYKEIAEALQVTEAKVRQKLHRARETIKDRLQKEWGIY